MQNLDGAPSVSRDKRHPVFGGHVSCRRRNRVAMWIPRRVAQPGVEFVDFGRREGVLHLLSFVMPLAGWDSRTVGEIALPHPVGSHQANRRLPALFGECRALVSCVNQSHLRKTGEKGGRTGTRDFQASREAFERAGAAGTLARVDMFNGILKPYPFIEPRQTLEVRHDADSWPQQDR